MYCQWSSSSTLMSVFEPASLDECSSLGPNIYNRHKAIVRGIAGLQSNLDCDKYHWSSILTMRPPFLALEGPSRYSRPESAHHPAISSGPLTHLVSFVWRAHRIVYRAHVRFSYSLGTGNFANSGTSCRCLEMQRSVECHFKCPKDFCSLKPWFVNKSKWCLTALEKQLFYSKLQF